ncbi:anti-phage dCTP deaminase [Hafnia paralvei]|uniref:anti-phage dCTP deaminase n=1 Tax=Hafnia paralvei TaxID=546367 RepID=UPI000BB577B4|nr:anti-phage dCTP deaminase [Hafnia paralvei]MCE9946541.1 deoxycytidylate deaminase [Hafnia paralvei]PNK69285.1 deoxycytidylate deaminase [Hafnia paralvei]
MEKMISELFMENSKFVLIGLTGRTGSGCTTAAKILESEQADIPDENQINDFYTGLDIKRYLVTKRYISKHWNKFYSIKVSDLISAYILLQETDEVAKFILTSASESKKPVSEEMLNNFLNTTSFNKTLVKSSKTITRNSDSDKQGFISYKEMLVSLLNHKQDINEIQVSNSDFIKFLEAIRRFTEKFKKGLNNLSQGLYISVYQDAGNSIRKTSHIKSTYKDDMFSPMHVFHLPETMNRIIKLLRKNDGNTFIVIDAIRNPYEVKFFRDRYSAFHLVSINAPDKDRKRYLQNVHKFTNDQLADLDARESGDKLISNTSEENRSDPEKSEKDKSKDAYFEFTSQNVKRCIEISDIHLFNPRNELENNNVLKAQLYWYIALMLHPGLITPTAMERVMQIAFTAKLNSGCLSRQVGAVLTDNNNSVKAIGWNDVAKGQVPCSLRSLEGVINDFDEVVYSEFERNDKDFRAKAKEKLLIFKTKGEKISGYNLSYCFKSLKNSIDQDKNQVHTRALHAEENAFLQISKYGGMGIEGGKLYTTASPCELCAKKAYQLGIKDIVFIDPYPGIAISHILSIGESKPNLVQFRGAIGRAYHKIYEQIMPYKDELDFLGIIKN